MPTESYSHRFIARLTNSCTTSRVVAAMLAMTVAIMLIQLATLTKYPPAFVDESWFSNAAWTWLITGMNFDAIHKGVLDQFGYEWLPRPFIGEFPYLVMFKFFGLGFFQARLTSWIIGCCLLVATYRIGSSLYSSTTGALAVLLLSASPAFIDASHYARQDIFLALTGMLVFGLARRAFDTGNYWLHLVVGLIAGASLDIHQNGCVFVLGVASLYFVQFGRTTVRQGGAWLCALGGLIGVGYFFALHYLPSPEAYSKLFSFYFGRGAVLPVMSGPLGIARGFVIELLRYDFHEDGLHFAVITLCLGFLLWRRSDRDKQLLGFGFGVLLGFALIVDNNSSLYRVLSFPFFLLAVAEVFVYFMSGRRVWTPERAFVVGLGLLLVAYYPLVYLYQLKHARKYDYDRIARQIESAMPGEAAGPTESVRVMAIPTWWFGLAEYDFRSSHNMRFLMWYNDLSLTESIDKVKPDFIVLDDELRDLLYDEESPLVRPRMWQIPEREFLGYLSQNGSLVGNFFDPTHGHFEIYEMNDK